MSAKKFRTAQGKILDLGALILKNEKIRAVGNMNVNARGDIIDAQNIPIKSRNKQVNDQYRKSVTTNVVDSPVISSRPSNGPETKNSQATAMPTPPENFDDEPESNEGLAAAIRRARASQNKE